MPPDSAQAGENQRQKTPDKDTPMIPRKEYITKLCKKRHKLMKYTFGRDAILNWNKGAPERTHTKTEKMVMSIIVNQLLIIALHKGMGNVDVTQRYNDNSKLCALWRCRLGTPMRTGIDTGIQQRAGGPETELGL